MKNAFLCALQQLSLLAPHPPRSFQRSDSAQSLIFFPLIGAVGGLLAASAFNIALILWIGHPGIAAAAGLLAEILFLRGVVGPTGQVTDGFFAQRRVADRSEPFLAMRLKKRGLWGAAAIAATIALQWHLMSELTRSDSWAILIGAGAIGRWGVAFAIAAFPTATDAETYELTSSGWADAGEKEIMLASLLAFACSALAPYHGLPAFAAAALAAGILAVFFARRFGCLNMPLAQTIGLAAQLSALAMLLIH